MRHHCIVGQHDIAPGAVRNQGLEFSHCVSCRRDMVRSSRRWRPVPRGFRVVWKGAAPRQTEIDAAQLFFDLPPGARSRSILSPGRRSPGSGLLDLVVVGLRYLLWGARGRFETWRKTVLLRPASPQTLRLTADPNMISGI